MNLTKQQALVLFDIVKGCLYSTEQQFAGYSKEDIMRLINDIISQQDNSEFIEYDKSYLFNNYEKEEPISEDTGSESDDFWND